VFDVARATPLPPPTVEEEMFYSEYRTAMEEFEKEEGVFCGQPLDVAGGVAVTEEAVGFGTADVITQV
jgi:hypothetical protein